VSQPEIAKKSIKPPILALRPSKVIELGANREPVYDFLLVINSNLGLISHRYWDTATYWPKIANFTVPETRIFHVADGEDLVIPACTGFDWSTRVPDRRTDRIAMAKTRQKQ